MTAIQCQARISAQKQCTKTTKNPDGFCHQHTGGRAFSASSGGSGRGIPPVGGAKPVATSSEAPSFFDAIGRMNESRKLRGAILDAIPERTHLLNKPRLKAIKDPEKLGLILELSKSLFPERKDPHERFWWLEDIIWSKKNEIADMVALKEPLGDGSLGLYDFIELRAGVRREFGEQSEEGGTAPNIAAHYKVKRAVEAMSDSVLDGYWVRPGLPEKVNTNPEKVDEIISTLSAPEYG